MLSPHQFKDFNVGDVSWSHSAADYNHNSTEDTRKQAIMGADRQYRGQTDRPARGGKLAKFKSNAAQVGSN